MIKSKRIRWAGNVARMGERRNAHTILLKEDQDAGGWILLTWFLGDIR
jgi:hypothetical protein